MKDRESSEKSKMSEKTEKNSLPEMISDSDLENETGTDGREAALKEIFGYYSSMTSPSSQENIVSMLQEIQELYGYISTEHAEMAAEAAGVKMPVIDCIMKLYKSLKPAPYRHKLIVCTGKNCHKAGKDMLNLIKKELGIKGKVSASGALSHDKNILLETRDCLKQCRTAPNLLVDGKLHPSVGEEELKKMIKKIKKDL